MQHELNYFKIEDCVGGNQDWFKDILMRIGGCAAVTACDLCIFLSYYHDIKNLYPFDNENITKSEYICFSKIIKPYLHPRLGGIDKASIYIEGFNSYLSDCNISCLKLTEFNCDSTSLYDAYSVITYSINKNFPIPYLLLLHEDKLFKNYNWHWFMITGYRNANNKRFVKVTTYGKSDWFNFDSLWNTKRTKKGGFIIVDIKIVLNKYIFIYLIYIKNWHSQKLCQFYHYL